MARTTGPLFSQEASGTVGKIMTHSSWKGRSYVRQAVTPTNPNSPTQISVRAMLAWLTSQWNGPLIADADRATWSQLARATKIPPFNAYLANGLDQWTQFKSPSTAYPNLHVGTIGTYSGGAPTATATTKSVTFAWNFSIISNNWGLLFFRDSGPTCTPSHANLVHIQPTPAAGAANWIDGPLPAGQYTYRFGRITKGGNFSLAVTTARTVTVL